jgi:hypothetical protein
MGLVPEHWNVVIVGRWNRAILTPKGIASRVFGLPEARQFAVMVPMDGHTPFQVRHPDYGIIAYVDSLRLYLSLEAPNHEDLARAMGFGRMILEKLPETPISAAGINIKYRATEKEPAQADLVKAQMDDSLANAGRIVEWKSSRSLQFGKGLLNVEAVVGTGFNLSYNFHRASETLADLVEWLNTPIGDIRDKVTELSNKLGLDMEGATHDPAAD